jgi:uncharacterized membrane protein
MMRAEQALWVLFGFNAAAVALWELAARRLPWLAGRWGPRLLALAAGVLGTTLALLDIFDNESPGGGLLGFLLCIGALYYVYRWRWRDLFMLAGGSLAVVVVAAGMLSKILLDRAPGDLGYLVIAGAVIGLSAAAGRWLTDVAREEASEG